MLDDTARKLLRVMVQFNGHFHHMPKLKQLQRLSGRRPAAIKAGILQLVEQHYIEWDDNLPVESAVVIESWERGVPFKNKLSISFFLFAVSAVSTLTAPSSKISVSPTFAPSGSSDVKTSFIRPSNSTTVI